MSQTRFFATNNLVYTISAQIAQYKNLRNVVVYRKWNSYLERRPGFYIVLHDFPQAVKAPSLPLS
jgi:hypothetical protein